MLLRLFLLLRRSASAHGAMGRASARAHAGRALTHAVSALMHAGRALMHAVSALTHAGRALTHAVSAVLRRLPTPAAVHPAESAVWGAAAMGSAAAPAGLPVCPHMPIAAHMLAAALMGRIIVGRAGMVGGAGTVGHAIASVRRCASTTALLAAADIRRQTDGLPSMCDFRRRFLRPDGARSRPRPKSCYWAPGGICRRRHCGRRRPHPYDCRPRHYGRW